MEPSPALAPDSGAGNGIGNNPNFNRRKIMAQTFFCIETGNSLYGGTVRHFFNSPAAVMSFLKATREGWTLRVAEWDDGELVPTRPITNCQFIDEDGGIDAVLERLEAAA